MELKVSGQRKANNMLLISSANLFFDCLQFEHTLDDKPWTVHFLLVLFKLFCKHQMKYPCSQTMTQGYFVEMVTKFLNFW